MAATAQTKIFGVKLGVDPRILAGVLIGLALLLFWYNSRSEDDSPSASTAARRDAAATIPMAAPVVRPKATASRRTRSDADRGTLRLRAIDPTRGDVDPTLRLDLLARLQGVDAAPAGRSLFEVGPAPLSAADQERLSHPPGVPKVLPKPVPPDPGSTTPAEQPINIPLKYYGFVKNSDTGQNNAGLFLDGDNVVVGAEGDVVLKRYLVVSLTPASARLEDTQVKKGQTLSVVPAANP